MKVELTDTARTDFEKWKNSGNLSAMGKIKAIMEELQTSPYTGIAKPEALKHDLSGKWSRRIKQQHRIVYSVEKEVVTVHSLYGHFDT